MRPRARGPTGGSMNIFPIAPAESRYLWFLIPVIVILLGAMVLVATSVRGAHSSSFEIRPEGLRLRGALYGRLIPKAQLRLNLVRRVDLTRNRTSDRSGAGWERVCRAIR